MATFDVIKCSIVCKLSNKTDSAFLVLFVVELAIKIVIIQNCKHVSSSIHLEVNLTEYFFYTISDPKVTSLSMEASLQYLCEIQNPNCVQDSLSNARYTEFICSKAASKLGYGSFKDYLNENLQNLWTKESTIS